MTQSLTSGRSGKPRPPAVQLQRDARALARSLRRRWRLRLTVRALWIALTVLVAGLVLRLFGVNVPWPSLAVPAGLIALFLIFRAWIFYPALPLLMRDYDRHFQTHDLLSSGLEVARTVTRNDKPAGQVEQRLIEQTLLATYAVRRRVSARPLVPWRDLEMLLGVALIGVGLLIAGRSSPLPAASPLDIRTLPTPVAAEQEQPESQPEDQPVSETEQPGEGPLSPEDQAAADAIAEALSDNGATRSAADALEQGDTSEAASDLRELSDQADQLSNEARNDIAEGLRDAAEQLRADQPERAQRLEEQANQLQGGAESAAEGLEDLADMVDDLGGDGSSVAEAGQGAPSDNPSAEGQGQSDAGGEPGSGTQPGSGAGSGLGGESRGTPTDPAQAQGDITPLPPDPDATGPRTAATGPEGPTVQLEAGGTRAGENGQTEALTGGADTPLSGDADPLRIPPEYRDVVENYFSP